VSKSLSGVGRLVHCRSQRSLTVRSLLT